jgi:uncharacterized protein YdeI (YjbR/CyaY-like superfamily)
MKKVKFRDDGLEIVFAENREAWRAWLQQHHQEDRSIWLVIYHKKSDQPSVTYDEAVDEALCFGWIDSKPNKRDEESYFQLFSRRNPNSNWSAVNKEKIQKLLSEGRMAEAGLQMIEIAKENGTWNALDEVEQLIIPTDLDEEFSLYEQAAQHFDAFPRSVKRGILEWIFNAKRSETRKKRIAETARLAEKNIRANQYR